ncbi:MAG TPA: PH domain-containing protein [Stellaceae bacterium]|nr:PH domain-containing protein [Stellaceae bacterium]
MSYIQHILQPGETLKHVSRLHWIVYLPGLLLLALAVAVLIGAESQNQNLPLLSIAAVLMVFCAASLLRAWFRRWTTEIAVTNRRIIFKKGFIRRHTIEMNMDKVESVDVDQSILGRILGYGDILVRGTGASIEPFRMIGSPIQFRNQVTAG